MKTWPSIYNYRTIPVVVSFEMHCQYLRITNNCRIKMKRIIFVLRLHTKSLNNLFMQKGVK